MRTCPREAGPTGPRLSSPRERERHNADGHKSGGQYIAVLFGLQLPLTRKLCNKVRGTYFSKNCVARLYSLRQYVLCVCIVNHDHGYTTKIGGGCGVLVRLFRGLHPQANCGKMTISPLCQQAGFRPETITGSLRPSTSNQLGIE